MPKTKVAIVKGQKQPTEPDIERMVRRAIALAGGVKDIISPGDRVIIKPNLVYPVAACTGATTDWRVCKAIARMVKEAGAQPIIAESSAIGVDTEKTFQVCSYDELRKLGIEVIDLKKSRTVNVPVPKGRAVTELPIPEEVVNADVIISVPVLKTHDQCLATLSLKNMKGVLQDPLKKKFHTTYGVFQAVADLNTVVKPALSVVDGLVGQEGLGPVFGNPVGMGIIIAGRDPVAVDTVAGLVMGIEPHLNETTRLGAEMGLGTMDINQIRVAGEPIERVRRRFKLGSEAVPESITYPEGFELVFNEKACTGCRNGVLSALRDLSVEGKLELARNWRVIAGEMQQPPQTDKRVMLVGFCTRQYQDYGAFVKGCAPNNVDIISAFTGETGRGFFGKRG